MQREAACGIYFYSIALFNTLHNQSIIVTIHYFLEKRIEKIRLIVESEEKENVFYDRLPLL